MPQFIKQPPQVLNMADGTLTVGNTEPNIGMPFAEFHKQVMALIKQKVPLKEALKAIDSHPDITDKDEAKKLAEAIYRLTGAESSK